MEPITFIVPVCDEHVYSNCFLASPLFQQGSFQIIAQREYSCAGLAFNKAIQEADTDLLVFCHQDVVLPPSWDQAFVKAIASLQESKKNVGVIGCIGITHAGIPAGHIYRHDRELFPSTPLPQPVQTFDELLISFRKSSNLRFDEELPGFNYYAVDMCLQAEKNGMVNFAVDSPCFHQGKGHRILPRQFYEAQKYMVKKWRPILPVQTLSGRLLCGPGRFLSRLKRRLIATFRLRNPWWMTLPTIDPAEILKRDRYKLH